MRSDPDIGRNPALKRFYQLFGSIGGPGEMQEVISVKVQVVDLVVPPSEYHGYVQPVSEPRFVVHGATGTTLVVSEVGYHEPRPTYFGDDLVVNLAQEVRLSVYSYWLIAYRRNCRSDGFVVQSVRFSRGGKVSGMRRGASSRSYVAR